MSEISKSFAETYSFEKQVLEALLAKALYDKFNQGDALFNLQILALRCIYGMLHDTVALRAACNIEDKLAVWSKIGGNTPEKLLEFYNLPWDASAGKFDASEVSDIIRLYGQWVEGNPKPDPTKAAKGLDKVIDGGSAREGLKGAKETDAWGQNLTQSFAVKDAYRPGVMTGKGDWKREVEQAWGDGEGRFQGVKEKVRDRLKAPKDHPFAIPPHVDLRQDKTAFAGIQTKQAQQDSNVLKIDHLFGLFNACDISGTTADTVFALEMLGADYLSASYYMLPLATIVHKLHHSLLEVALALTLNGVIDYEIGFYTSLLPKDVKTVPRELVGIDGTLKQYEDDRRNRHFLRYYDINGELAGGYLLNRSEAFYLRAAGGLSAANLLKKAPHLPKMPQRSDLKEIFPQVIP